MGTFSLWHWLVVLAVVLTAIVHLGLAGPAMSDLQREIWARVGGKTSALVALGVTLTLSLTIYGPRRSWLLMAARQATKNRVMLCVDYFAGQSVLLTS